MIHPSKQSKWTWIPRTFPPSLHVVHSLYLHISIRRTAALLRGRWCWWRCVVDFRRGLSIPRLLCATNLLASSILSLRSLAMQLGICQAPLPSCRCQRRRALAEKGYTAGIQCLRGWTIDRCRVSSDNGMEELNRARGAGWGIR